VRRAILRAMHPSGSERLRRAFPAVAKDLLGPLAEVLVRARAACGGDVDVFLILLVVALRSFEDPRIRALSLDLYVAGDWTGDFSRATNVQSISGNSGIAKETVRRKVGRLVEDGWIERRGRRLQLSREGLMRLAPVRDATLRLGIRAFEAVAPVVETPGGP
jgi:hypothetical protein